MWFLVAALALSAILIAAEIYGKEKPVFKYRGFSVFYKEGATPSAETNLSIKAGINRWVRMYPDHNYRRMKLTVVKGPVRVWYVSRWVEASGVTYPDVRHIKVRALPGPIISTLVCHEMGHQYKYDMSEDRNTDRMHLDAEFWNKIDSGI